MARSYVAGLIGLALTLSATSAHAEGSGWQIAPATDTSPLTLTYDSGGQVAYRFECLADAVAITQTGVTELMDFSTGQQVDDAADSLPSTASMMALFSGKGDPQLQPAISSKNPAGGWDLTIELAKKDRQVRGMAKSEMMSLFTSGYTMAVAMDDDSRAIWSAFLKDCKAD